MFEKSKHVPKTEKRCCVFKDNSGTEFLNRRESAREVNQRFPEQLMDE